MSIETRIQNLTDLAGWTQEQKNELERLGRLLRDSKLIDDTEHVSDDRCLIHYLMRPSEMCLAGDTLIPTMPCPGATRKSYTIKEIADAFTERGKNNSWVKLLKIRTVDRDGTIRPTHIRCAAMTGRKPAYRITTVGPLPRTLIATGNHPILTPRGYRRVDRLTGGDKVVANGVAVLSNAQLHSLWAERYRLIEIARLLKVSSVTALRRLRAAGVDTSRRAGFPRKPDQELLDPRARARRLRKPFCEVCGEPASLVHHLDENPHNNSPKNLVSLCLACHWAFHANPFQLRVYETTITSIESVGIIDVYGLETADGNHNYVANGLVVHNCAFRGRAHGVGHLTRKRRLTLAPEHPLRFV